MKQSDVLDILARQYNKYMHEREDCDHSRGALQAIIISAGAIVGFPENPSKSKRWNDAVNRTWERTTK